MFEPLQITPIRIAAKIEATHSLFSHNNQLIPVSIPNPLRHNPLNSFRNITITP